MASPDKIVIYTADDERFDVTLTPEELKALEEWKQKCSKAMIKSLKGLECKDGSI